MSDFEKLVKKAQKFHGGLCPGIVIGTRMSIAGLKKLDMNLYKRNKDLIVYLEIDRCMADAVQAITGCSLGHRSLKYLNYGKFASTFVDTSNNRAVRISTIENSNRTPGEFEMDDMVKELSQIPEEELFKIEEVYVEIPEEDLPGFPKFKAVCNICGEQILDKRELTINGDKVCHSCANKPYYTKLETN